MNVKLILYILSRLCLGLAAVLALPLLLALLDGGAAFRAFALAIAVTLCLGWGLHRSSRDADTGEMLAREGIGAVFFSWLLAALIAALPYVFAGLLGPCAAFFESMSGLTTTGATALTEIDSLPLAILFWRSLTHWLGGIGIIVLFVALLPQIAGGAVYLFNAEVSGFSNSRILPRIRMTALKLFEIYLVLTVTLALVLGILGVPLFSAVNHAFSTIATGGFSIYNSSVAYFDNAAIEVVIGLFMILAGGNFALYYHVTNSGLQALWRDLEFRVYLGVIAVITVLITVNIVSINGYTPLAGLRAAFFQTASFASTTGFVSDNYDAWPAFAKLLLALMYFSGGCAGSTAGGIKICRFIVLMKTVAAELRRTLHPQMLLTVYYDKKALPLGTVMNISRFFFMYILVIAVLALVLAATGLPVEEAVFGVAACVSSVGPAFGSLGAQGNFAAVTPLGKIVLSLAMLLGRLELFTVLALLRSEFWRASKRW